MDYLIKSLRSRSRLSGGDFPRKRTSDLAYSYARYKMGPAKPCRPLPLCSWMRDDKHASRLQTEYRSPFLESRSCQVQTRTDWLEWDGTTEISHTQPM